MLPDRFELWVPGRAVPQGSKSAFVSKSTGRPVVVDKDVRLPRWRMTITNAALEQQAEYRHTRPALTFPIVGAIGIKVDFVMERPKTHYLPANRRRPAPEVSPTAPKYPAQMPDIDKLLRAVFDALTDARVWKDDGQAVWVQTTKTYGDTPGVHITLGAMS